MFYQWGTGNGDTIHLNSLTWRDGECYVTAFGPKSGALWSSAKDGYLMNIASGEKLIKGLHHPHSAIQRGDEFLLCESTRMILHNQLGGKLDFPFGFIRGLAVVGQHLCVGSGKKRTKSKSTGVAVKNSADSSPIAGRCGIGVFEIANWATLEGQLLKFIDLESCGTEIYDLLPID